MDVEDLSREVGALLRTFGLTLCTAESCTGGLIASSITDVAGSSAYFLGGVVAYSNESKRRLLDVSERCLADFGAVSAPVALAMARNARDLFSATVAISATGIAGPGGGSVSKPVGLVYVAIVAPRWAACHRYLLPHDRMGNKRATVARALRLVLDWCQGPPLD
ncbi:MAG: CinA family protein [Anaerolineae bacterium]|nr:CinA family protein [Anaerolineae bacterium]